MRNTLKKHSLDAIKNARQYGGDDAQYTLDWGRSHDKQKIVCVLTVFPRSRKPKTFTVFESRSSDPKNIVRFNEAEYQIGARLRGGNV